jgi:protein-disulfide isomerase
MTPQTHAMSLAVPPEPTDHLLGSEHARVTLIEYGDFECPSCKVAATTPKLLLERYPNKIRFIFRHFPLQDAHPHAVMAAEVAEAAAGQGKFWSMHDVLFENQSHLEAHHLRGYAERLGLDMARYTAEMDDEIYLQRVREHMESGKESGVRGTPTFFVNGRIHDVSFGLRALFDAVEEALKHHRR